ncbi:Tyrosine-protein phosphatase SIW14 [Meyerozyma sp. JA9]|nr:Tyrosine-protein phosphatase SIW14 [Meyerozyma sp. JA9]
MADFDDEPFQMDEEVVLASSERELSLTEEYFARDSPFSEENNIRLNSQIDQPELTGAKSGSYKVSESMNDNPEALAQLLAQRLGKDAEKNIGEESTEYDEDADDKLDIQKQKELESEFRAKKIDLRAQEVTPPENFAPVINNIYRSSFPQIHSFSFLRTLKLRSILCLIPEEYPQMHKDFFEEEGIKLFQMGMSGNKEPFVKIPPDLVTEAVKVVLDPRNQPILIHCNRGKHRTGCLVGVIRRLQRWSLTIIFDEYRKFAAPKERPMDQQFIELYNETEIERYARERGLLPLSWD